jgi:hypothetical protein
MNKEQAIAAITALTGKDIFPRIAKQSQAYKTAIAAVGNPGVPQICGESMGSGNYASSKSWQAQTAVILMRAGITYNCFNDAPKGGKRGDKIVAIIDNE